MKNDDAIAPIVAVMLILVVVVTLLSVYNATYLPGLKQSAEVQHLHEVEEGVLKFGSALEEAASLKRTIRLSQQIPLGGGDILLNSLKSGGSLHVQQESEPYLTIILENSSPFYYQCNLTLVNFSYWTVNNFWVDQGYSWQYGYVNVSRSIGSGDGTPLQYATMGRVEEECLIKSYFADTLIEIIHDKDNPKNITIDAVNFTTGSNVFSSGNGFGMLKLDAQSNKTGRLFQEVDVTFTIHNTDFKQNLQMQDELVKLYEEVNVTLIMTDITVSAY